jgi:hypothetical protein
MPCDLVATAIAAVALLWVSARTLRRLCVERSTTVVVMWREATARGWMTSRRYRQPDVTGVRSCRTSPGSGSATTWSTR